MKQINLREMYNAGVHLGSSVKKLNPKMKPYIMCTHDGIAIIDILKTYTRLFRITLFLKKVIATEGYQVLFVGTQKSIASLIAEIAIKSSSYYINERWKGGFLTNFKTMKGQTNYDTSSTKNNLKTRPLNYFETNRQDDFGAGAPPDGFPGGRQRENPRHTRTDLEFSDKSEFEQKNNDARPIEDLSNSSKGNFPKKNKKNNTQLFESNELTSLPDLVIIVGQEKELKAIKECQKLNIPTITILDSDGDPEKTSLFIPANDDSRSSVEFILKHLGQSILVGRLLYDKKTKIAPSLKQGSGFEKSRSSRRS